MQFYVNGDREIDGGEVQEKNLVGL